MDFVVPFLGWMSLVLSVLASIHVLLYKRNTRSATAWIGLIWLSPLFGALLYPLFGINRVRRRAKALRPGSSVSEDFYLAPIQNKETKTPLQGFSERVTGRPTVPGNQVVPLWGGDEAYPVMLQAIANAKHSVGLSTYIFDRDAIGLKFVEVLAAAKDRGVEVRVLIDDFGSRYSFHPADTLLKKKGVRCARFLKVFNMRSMHLMNLRLHRKLLVCDGKEAFTGGMNIREGNMASADGKKAIEDVHFQVLGPVVRDLQSVFVEDWGFTTGEDLDGSKWFPKLEPVGQMVCRAIVDGPDSHLDTVRIVLQGAIALSKKSLRIMTPYFIPDQVILSSLIVASLRGVKVQILLPENSNLPWCNWAMQAQVYELVKHGVDLEYAPGVFNHSKVFIVDDTWSLVGSSNWDERSLRLNFELNLECEDPVFANRLAQRFLEHQVGAKSISAQSLESLPIWIRLRDSIARLFMPYL